MKSFIFFMLLCFSPPAFAQNNNNPEKTLNLTLTARKLSAVSYFRIGMSVRIISDKGQNKIIRGYITHLERDRIIIESFKKKNNPGPIFISPEDIQKIRPLSRNGRKKAAIVLGSGGVYAGLMGLISKPGPLQYVVFLPAFGAAILFVYYYPTSFLLDLIREKSKKNGWFFSIEKLP
jgi:hypothetical protein